MTTRMNPAIPANYSRNMARHGIVLFASIWNVEQAGLKFTVVEYISQYNRADSTSPSDGTE